MGRLTFVVPDRSVLPAGAADNAYLSNHEETPVRTKITWHGEHLVAEREESESGTFTILWQTDSRGTLALTTGTLIGRQQPYLLPLELTRGFLYRLRTYGFIWPMLGLGLPEEYPSTELEATRLLARAATSQHDPLLAAGLAQQALERSLKVAELLMEAYGQQSLAARKQASPHAMVLVGAPLDEQRAPDERLSALLSVCNSFSVPLTWSTVEAEPGVYRWNIADANVNWCQSNGRYVCAGPLLRLEESALPRWVREGRDSDQFQQHLGRFIDSVVSRYRGRVQLWQVAAGLNTGMAVELSEEQRVRLAVMCIERLRQRDPATPIVLTFDQPWGEYLAQGSLQLSPIHFADALARGQIGLSGIGLEINFGFEEGCTLPRDSLDLSRQLDRWSVLNLPLLILLTLPGDTSPFSASAANWSKRNLPVIIAKPAVQAIFWGQHGDQPDGDRRDRGLFDAAGSPKPALEAFQQVRRVIE